MHVHTHDDGDYLLHLANGVTTIREMNGWPWRLQRRELLRTGRLLAPNMYITSRILNSSDFGGYALAVNDPESARAAVRKAAKDGYDAIKTHNGLEQDVFLAILDEANRAKLNVVGHIPVRSSVSEAIANGMHTAEHFKGYIDDSVLQISKDDWFSPSKNMQMYLTPTFYTYREHLRGAEAQAVIDADAAKLLPHRRLAWQRYADSDADDITQLRQTIRPKSEQIFRTLMPLNIAWLAGTDSGGYELMVPGEALLEELEILESLGLSSTETLRSATTRAAAAMGMAGKVGEIAVGANADALLLRKNPLEAVGHLRDPIAVIVRGIWLDDPASLPVNESHFDASIDTFSMANFEQAVALAERHHASGYAQSTVALDLWQKLAVAVDRPDLDARLADLRLE